MSIQALKDYIEENKRVWSSPIHGINHWEHVWSNGQEVGWAVDADLEVVEYFAYLHDCQRLSEGTDWLHGPRAAQFAQQNRELFDLSGTQFKELISAVAGHTKLQPGCKAGENPTIATCWDADRLDIWRQPGSSAGNLHTAATVDCFLGDDCAARHISKRRPAWLSRI